jgi:carboxypeptidase C (cathepsin A)
VTEAHRPVSSLLGLLALLALLAFPASVLAEQTPPQANAEAATASGPHALTPTTEEQAAESKPLHSVTHHTLDLDNDRLRYSATAGSLPLRDAQGKTAAEIFYVAYAREPGDVKRPVTFVFNGGPGAASAYLHLGAMGPKIVEASAKGEVLGPPPRLVENKESWLAFTDLVFVDPVGTGYSRAAGGKEEKDFWGVEQDTESLADFIRLYLVDAERMASPVFLVGESYGGFRAATITRKLQKTGGISPSGLVLVSPALDFALLHARDYNPLRWALMLPSFAAVNLESRGVTGREALGEALKDAERYALSDYLAALASGVEAGGKTASSTVAELTGLPTATVERHHARVPSWLFIKEFNRANSQVLSRYDGSVSGPDPNPSSTWPRGPDPVLDSTVPLWISAFVQ